jgi:hypothetical protein
LLLPLGQELFNRKTFFKTFSLSENQLIERGYFWVEYEQSVYYVYVLNGYQSASGLKSILFF